MINSTFKSNKGKKKVLQFIKKFKLILEQKQKKLAFLLRIYTFAGIKKITDYYETRFVPSP